MGLKTTRWVLAVTILIAIAPTMAASQGFYQPGPQYFAQPSVRIGYLFPNSAAKLTFDSTSGTALAIQDLGLSIDVRGVWTEFAVPVRGFGPLGLVVGFSYLFPVNKHSQETYELAPPANRQRDWTSSTQLWNIQAAITYNVYPSIYAMAGFRYESLLTNLKNPEGGNPALFGSGDAADLTFSGYLPFLGLQMERTLPSGMDLKAGAWGFPALPGSFEYVETVARGGSRVNGTTQRITANNEFRSGYFLEGLAELSVPVYVVQMGAFIKYSAIYGKTNADVNSFVMPGLLTTSYHNHVNVHIARSSWIVGGNVSFSFWFL